MKKLQMKTYSLIGKKNNHCKLHTVYINIYIYISQLMYLHIHNEENGPPLNSSHKSRKKMLDQSNMVHKKHV